MEITSKTTKEKLFKSKTSNKKIYFHKSPSYNKSSNRSKQITDPINYNKSNYREKLIYNNLKKYSISKNTFNKYIINDIIFDHRNHIVAEFKNYLLWDETSEFLKRYYPKNDIMGRLPKISEYYEQYTLFTPNYLGNDGLILIIMIKAIKRKKKYLHYLEEKEQEEKNNKLKKNLNKNFEPVFSEEILSLTKTKSKSFYSSCVDLSKNTLELSVFDNEVKNNKRKSSENKIYKDKNNHKLNIENNEFKNSISFTEIFDDLSSHFSVLINNTNSNNYKEYKNKPKIVKNFVNKKNISKKEINTKNNAKKLLTKQQKQKTLSKKPSINKQQNLVKKEKEKEKEKEIIYMKIKEIHKTNITQRKSNCKKNILSKEKNKKEKEKINDNNKENNRLILNHNNNRDIKKYQKVTIVNIKSKEKDNKENKEINSDRNYNNQTSKMKNISILNGNSGKLKKEMKQYEENINTINTLSNLNPQYYSLSKLIKNNKQSSAVKKVNIKGLNLLNFNPNIIPNLKRIVSKQKDKKIIFPRNFNLMYNNNTNKLNSMNKENYEQIKLLTDRDKENNKIIINTNENSKYIQLMNDNTCINNNKNNANIYFDQSDIFAKKVSKLIKKKHLSLLGGDNLSFKEPNNSNILFYKNDMNEKMTINNISNLNNNLRYKKNSVLRQLNSKRDVNLSNSKNNIIQIYNNISNNSIRSSSSLNSLYKKKNRLSNDFFQNNSMSKRKSLQKINLNLNLQINFNINLDKKNKKLILGKKLHQRMFNEITNNKNIGIQNNQKNDNNINNISIPLTQRCYYNVNQYHKYLGEQRSASSSNSKNKKKVKN